MCRDWTGDHEIHADEIEDVLRDMKRPEPTDEELEDMNRIWQEALRGCVEN